MKMNTEQASKKAMCAIGSVHPTPNVLTFHHPYLGGGAEPKGALQLMANTLTFLGYEPDWRDIFGTEEGH